MGKPWLENRKDSKLTKTFWHVWTIRSLLQRTKTLIITTKNLKAGNFSIAIVVEEMKHVATDKSQFECWDQSNSLAIFETSGLWRFWCKEKSKDFSISFSPQAWHFRSRLTKKIPCLYIRRSGSFNTEIEQYEWHSLEYRTVPIPMQGRESTKFYSIFLL